MIFLCARKRIAPWAVCLALLLPQATAAAVGEVLRSGTQVLASPDPRGERLLTLDRGHRVEVVARQGPWLRIRISLDGGFSFEGYVPTKAVTRVDSPSIGSPAQPRRQHLSPLVEPSAVRVSGRKPRSDTAATAIQDKMSNDRLSLAVGGGVLSYSYRVTTGGRAPADVFSYRLSGIGFHADGNYDFWRSLSGKWLASTSLFFQYGLYQTETRLEDSLGAEFLKVKTQNRSSDLMFRLSGEYRPGASNDAIAFGASLGAAYFSFRGDDVENRAGPIGLYVSNSSISVAPGLHVRFDIAKGLLLCTLGSDLLALNFVSESPGGSSGEDPSSSLGFHPYLRLKLSLSDRHEAGLGYSLRIQNISFRGSGSRVGDTNVTDGNIKTMLHRGILQYGYRF